MERHYGKHIFFIFYQVNQAIEANIVRPELPEEADRVEQLMVWGEQWHRSHHRPRSIATV